MNFHFNTKASQIFKKISWIKITDWDMHKLILLSAIFLYKQLKLNYFTTQVIK